ncbi:MAG: DNA repair protein RecO C-terminal domain-containing protein, partial [Cellulomonadaceae bacterium]|nr:DNA repair protein RecO C-terminal domain-containing protein [Cellulomonadaceae bacterium]
EPGPHSAFSVATGGAVCSRCRPPGSPAPAPETFALLAALLTGDWGIAEASLDRHRSEASGLVAAYAQFYLERSLRALRHVDRTNPGERAGTL